MSNHEGRGVLSREVEIHWASVGRLLSVRHEREYEAAVRGIYDLVDEIGTNERHPLYGLLDTLATLIHSYEETHHQLPEASGVDVLRYLMEEHELAQSDLPEIGSQGVVSKILRGKRSLNVRQIRALARRFPVSPAVFV